MKTKKTSTKVRHMRERQRLWLLNEKYNGLVSKEFFADEKRLLDGEPIDYLIGNSDFLGCHIDLTFHPFIPRPETEWWVEKALMGVRMRLTQSRKKVAHPLSVLDAFAGSGCIGISTLVHLPETKVDFFEKENTLIAGIKKSLEINRIPESRYTFVEAPREKYDVVFANPPYIDIAKKQRVAKGVIRYEPYGALFAKDQGLFYIKKLIRNHATLLQRDGTLYIEFGESQKQRLTRYLRDKKIENFSFLKDQYGKWRVVIIRRQAFLKNS